MTDWDPPMHVSQITTAEEIYEREIYAEVAWTEQRDRIAAVIGKFHRQQWDWWPGSRVIANAIMKELGNDQRCPQILEPPQRKITPPGQPPVCVCVEGYPCRWPNCPKTGDGIGHYP